MSSLTPLTEAYTTLDLLHASDNNCLIFQICTGAVVVFYQRHKQTWVRDSPGEQFVATYF
ncbi:uncharacterized protein PHALS_10450 [Plasmopara halstedii]|uniref:Uncharacterized protein n=1 Tax=Plasmopara halstedii TaxID=4781 RepID=A0A0P1AH14_PLAHL|nr:uncharacterized protein PHALS_10450 [Plasmopara halstedii]CEG40238.1 hypothetical protein PHALS_10450 [Plasmopara halstedii]|eukprot:XP_024576607.1 hypothetical protein PHALS_10450 [Plasmopara halstedii]